jgi:hypothetical protein
MMEEGGCGSEDGEAQATVHEVLILEKMPWLLASLSILGWPVRIKGLF